MLFRSNDTATTEIYTIQHTLSLHDALPIARLPFWDVFRVGWPFTLVLALVTLLVTYVPWISLGPIGWINW